MDTLISVIIPVYNAAKYITNCLKTVIDQSYKNIEIILIDDCGNDNSIDLAKQILSTSNRCWSIIHQSTNQGVSKARNTGILKASGEYIFFMDADDELSVNCIEILAEPLIKKNFDFVVGGYEDYGLCSKLHHPYSAQSLEEQPSILKAYAKGEWHVMPWNKLCRKQFLVENNLFFLEGQKLHEDYIWSYECAAKANSVFLSQEVTYKYRFNDTSAMKSATIEEDLAAYIPALNKMNSELISQECLTWKYYIIEGKKCGILYSLLQIKEYKLYNKYYRDFHKIIVMPPFKAFKSGIIDTKYLLRDLGNIFSSFWGNLYRRLFYNLFYKIRGKKIEGAIWQ